MSLTLGSLFDGIGGFPLAAQRHGITPAWASEIEAAPVSITRKHFPEMLHLGNITEISGAEIAPVDIITFGSPCQDLSVAGKRAGLDGERSGLFMEAVRIIREMREATNGAKPRWCVWENVHGAFSSSGGEDFLAVIREVAETADKDIHVSRPPTADGVTVWQPAGAVMGDGGSLAWRLMDAQYWGVPQRRRRIFLVADFGGGRAGEILFKPDRVPWDIAAGGKAREGAAADASGCFGETGVVVLNDQGGASIGVEAGDVSPTLRAETHGNLPAVCAGFSGGQGAKASGSGYGDEMSPTLKGAASGSNQVPCVVFDARGNGNGKIAPTIVGDHQNRVTDYTALAVHQNQCGEVRMGEVANTINTNGNASGRNAPLVCHCIQGNMIGRSEKSGADGIGVTEDVSYALTKSDRHAVAAHENRAPAATCLPIHDKATRHKGGGDGRNDDGASNGLGIGAEGDPCPTLDTSSRHAVAYTPSSFAQYAEGVGTLKANGGDLGGGSETLVAIGLDGEQNAIVEKMGTIRAHSSGGNEHCVGVFAMQGFGDYKESESALALKSRDFKDATDLVGYGCAVRRLIPTECERLQGFPDGWTAYGHDGKPISDTQRYKALGNSVAIPCVDFIMGNIAKIMEAR